MSASNAHDVLETAGRTALHTEAQIHEARILIVDDERPNVILLQRLLEMAGYFHLTCLTDSREVLPACRKEVPDLILLDLHMPNQDGFAVLNELEPVIAEEGFLPILVLTADITPQARRRALTSGAMDFLTKPFDTEEVSLRSRNLIRTRLLHRLVRQQILLLEDRVKERTQDLEKAQEEILERLALASEYRDDCTGEHAKRVGDMSAYIARALGLREHDVEMIRLAAPLHDLGKVALPDSILHKPSRLTAEEFRIVQEHCEIGARILGGSTSPLLQLAEQIVLTHHEHWAGGGYPHNLMRTEIPLAGRIVAVADVFDALTHKRPYKEAWSVPHAMDEIQLLRGKQFDPAVVDALETVLRAAGLLHSERLVA